MRKAMFLALAMLLGPHVAKAQAYADAQTRQLILRMVAAHGGMQAWQQVSLLRFWVFTRNTGAAEPWLSRESVEPATLRGTLEWPVLGARAGSDGEAVWSLGWPYALSPGFFSLLSYSFITLPFLTQQDGVVLDRVEVKRLPNDSTLYATVGMTMERPRGTMPGTYYRLYIDPESHLLKALEFDISHPGMAANPDQPLGPNIHVFDEWKEVGGLLIPSHYVSFGFNQRTQDSSSAVHYVFDVSLGQRLDNVVVEPPPGAVPDTLTMRFWQRSGRPGG